VHTNLDIPEEILEKAVAFATRYSGLEATQDTREYVKGLLESKVLSIMAFGGEVVWKIT
jgi:hypothetical protein